MLLCTSDFRYAVRHQNSMWQMSTHRRQSTDQSAKHKIHFQMNVYNLFRARLLYPVLPEPENVTIKSNCIRFRAILCMCDFLNCHFRAFASIIHSAVRTHTTSVFRMKIKYKFNLDFNEIPHRIPYRHIGFKRNNILRFFIRHWFICSTKIDFDDKNGRKGIHLVDVGYIFVQTIWLMTFLSVLLLDIALFFCCVFQSNPIQNWLWCAAARWAFFFPVAQANEATRVHILQQKKQQMYVSGVALCGCALDA